MNTIWTVCGVKRVAGRDDIQLSDPREWAATKEQARGEDSGLRGNRILSCLSENCPGKVMNTHILERPVRRDHGPHF